MKKKSITSNYIYNLSYQLVVLLIPILTMPYLTRVLGAEKLGIYSYTYSIVTIFFLISALGLNTYGQREIAYVQDNKEKRSKIFWELLVIRAIATIISVISLIVFSYITKQYSIYYKIFTIYIISNLFDITWLYQGLENFKGVAVRNLIVKIIYIISIFLFVNTKSDLGIYILLFSLLTLITNITFWIGIKDIVFPLDVKSLKIKRHIKQVVIFFIPQIASLIYTVLDKTMIGIMVKDISHVSFYEQASYIVKTILMLITTAGTVMISRMSNSFQKKDYSKLKKYMKKIINFVWLFGCALLFGICAIIDKFVPWFYGSEYLDTINLVYVMSPLIIIIGLNNIIGIQYLIPTKQQSKYAKAVVIGAVINVAFNLILISLIGAIGAAISSVLSELIILLIELYYIKDIITIWSIIKPNIKYILFGIIMFISVYLSGFIFGETIISTTLQVIIGALIYITLLVISKDNFFKDNILEYLKKVKRS